MGPAAPDLLTLEGGDGVARMKLNIKKGLLISLTGIVGLIVTNGALAAPTVSKNCTTATNGVQFCNEQAQMEISQSDQKVETLSLDSSGVLQLRLEMNPAPPKSQQRGCRWVTGGTNSYFDARGRTVWISWAGKRAYICHTGRGPTGWQKKGPGKVCWNFFAPPKVQPPAPVFRGRWKVVQHFNYNVRMSLKLTLHGTVFATASCSVGGAAASGTATGSDTESITVTAIGSGNTMAQASSKAQTAVLNSQEVNDLKAKVTASASFKMQVSASAQCQAPPPLPPPPPTPTPPPPPTPTPSPTPTYTCTQMTLSSNSIQTGQSVTATTQVATSGGAALQSITYTWGDGTSTTNGTSTSHTYSSAGSFTVIATANFSLPSGGAVSATSGACQKSLTVTSPPPPPTAHTCLILPVQGKDGMLYSATVGVDQPSGGPNGTIFWGDGASTPGLQGSHTYSNAGTYTISATVHFNDGGTASCSTTVSAQPVSPPPPPPPNP